MLSMQCAQCGGAVYFPEQFEGQQGRCPKCKTELLLEARDADSEIMTADDVLAEPTVQEADDVRLGAPPKRRPPATRFVKRTARRAVELPAIYRYAIFGAAGLAILGVTIYFATRPRTTPATGPSTAGSKTTPAASVEPNRLDGQLHAEWLNSQAEEQRALDAQAAALKAKYSTLSPAAKDVLAQLRLLRTRTQSQTPVDRVEYGNAVLKASLLLKIYLLTPEGQKSADLNELLQHTLYNYLTASEEWDSATPYWKMAALQLKAADGLNL